jgi:hypothetical protein
MNKKELLRNFFMASFYAINGFDDIFSSQLRLKIKKAQR